jgi:predicted transcriptional regulator
MCQNDIYRILKEQRRPMTANELKAALEPKNQNSIRRALRMMLEFGFITAEYRRHHARKGENAYSIRSNRAFPLKV